MALTPATARPHCAAIPGHVAQRDRGRRDVSYRQRKQSELHLWRRDGLGRRHQAAGDDGGGGGGISADESQPSYQNGVVSAFSTTQRTYPDVSADADPNSGVPIYDSYDDGTSTPWNNYNGGTSLCLSDVGRHHRHRRRRPGDRRAGIARRPHPDLAGTLQAAGRRLPRHHLGQHRPRPRTLPGPATTWPRASAAPSPICSFPRWPACRASPQPRPSAAPPVPPPTASR